MSLIGSGVELNATQVDGMTALHWAVYHNDLETTEALLNAGAKADVHNRYQVSPLSLACTNGNNEIVKKLLEAGADANTSLPGGETVLMTAARTGIPEVVRSLIKEGADVNAREIKQQTAIMWAAAEGHADVVSLLMDAGADYQASLESGFTAFFFAIRNGHTDVIRVFQEKGIDVNVTMIHEKRMRKGPKIGTSPLMLAIENGHYEIAIALIDAGANPNDQRSGYAPLHAMVPIRRPEIGDGDNGIAAPKGSGKLNTTQFLHELIKRGADVNARIIKGKERRGARIATTGATAFLLASQSADMEYLKILISYGADPLIPTADKSTPLMMAAGLGTEAVGEIPGTEEEALEVLKFQLALGADVNAVDNNGETAMHGAAYKNFPKVADLLVANGADIQIWNTKNNLGFTPLLIAEGYRPGNYKPDANSIKAFERIMLAQGVAIPTGPKPGQNNYN